MKTIPFKSSLFFVLFCIVGQLSAQTRAVQGVVTTFDSIAVQGAAIKAQGTKQIVLTDSAGNFTLVCNMKDKLKIMADGFFTESVKISAANRYVAVNLRLKAGSKNKELALGYVNVNERDKLNALASINSGDVDFSKYRTMEEAIAGRIPGVQITSEGIIIRGNSSINGPTYAQIVIDGVPSEASALSRMEPSTVKSINVIKDGSAALYGSKGANGVVVIETKSGRDN